jgi:hypothetical protein
VSPEQRLGEIVSALQGQGLSCLVMGGHAVRYYGLSRNTNDFDLHLAPDQWGALPHCLAQSSLFSEPPVEGPSWRPNDFRRFQIGRLSDGREEWLEFWRHNHLLPPFAELHARREEGEYGGRVLPFLSLPDLIRSKETARESDWQDVAALEEFLDARLLAQAERGERPLPTVLASVRSRRGFERLLQAGKLNDRAAVEEGLGQARLPVTRAFLLPCAPEATGPSIVAVKIEPVILSRLRAIPPGSPLHLALVEAVRRQYKLSAQATDQADKQATLAAQQRPGASPTS